MKVTSLAPWFAGSCAVLLAKDPCRTEVVNDLHGEVVNLAMVVASDRWEELAERLSRTLYSESIYAAAKIKMTCEPDPPAEPSLVTVEHLERAYWYFVLAWMGRNGVAGTRRSNYQISVRWTSKGGGSGTRWNSAIASIAAWHARMRSVTILRRDAFKLLESVQDESDTAIYVDPPYLAATRSKKTGGEYLHDFEAADHVRLARLLGTFRRARIVVSYYASPQLAELYPGWKTVDCAKHKAMHTTIRGSGREEAPEVLLVNGPVDDEWMFAGGQE